MTPPVSKTSRTPASSGGSSSAKKMVGFGADIEDGQTLMQTKREGTKSRRGKGKHTVFQGHECADGI